MVHSQDGVLAGTHLKSAPAKEGQSSSGSEMVEHGSQHRGQHESLSTPSQSSTEVSSDQSDSDYLGVGEQTGDTGTVLLAFPKAIMTSEEINSAADRLLMSDNQTTAIARSIGHSSSAYSLA